MTGWLAYLPSPPDSSLDLGPLSIRAYGLAIALGVIALYVARYGAGRMWVESLRVDPAAMVGGVRFNVLVGALALVSGGIAAVLLARRRPPSPSPPTPRHLLSRRPTAPISSSTRSSGSVGPP